MAIGKMRYRLQIQSYTRASDDAGGASLTWAKVADVYADIQPQGAQEAEFGNDNQLREVSKHKIYIRYRSDVSHRNRLVQTFKRDGVSTTRTFNIRGVVNMDNRFKMLELSCEEGVPT